MSGWQVERERERERAGRRRGEGFEPLISRMGLSACDAQAGANGREELTTKGAKGREKGRGKGDPGVRCWTGCLCLWWRGVRIRLILRKIEEAGRWH